MAKPKQKNTVDQFIKEDVEKVVGSLSTMEYESMTYQWSAFCRSPSDYEGTVVVDMVLKWLAEFRDSK